MPTSHFASAPQRADYADALVTELERILERISTIRVNLHKQGELKDSKEIDSYTAAPIMTFLDRATDPLQNARRIAVVEAYDQRRQTGSVATTMEG